MTVVAGILGASDKFGDDPGSHQGTSLAVPTAHTLISSISHNTRDFLKASVVLNSTAIQPSGDAQFMGSSTETALLKFASDYLGMKDLNGERADGNIVQMIPFNADRKWMASVIRLPSGKHRLLVKGAAEVIIDKCTEVLQSFEATTTTNRLTPAHFDEITTEVRRYAKRSLRVIAVAYRDLEDWVAEAPTASQQKDSVSTSIHNLSNLVLVGVFGLRDPLRPEIVDSVRRCQSA
ncbi:hypothetical protein FDECE_17326, partial [Fusarium decemcellulare]